MWDMLAASEAIRPELKEAEMKAPQTLFLLAADRDFRLLLGRKSDLAELAHRKADDFADVHNPFGSEPGRSHSAQVSFGNQERGVAEAEDRRRLARHAIAALEAEWARGRAQRVVLVAGPKMLGDLRDALPKALAEHVVAELHKDLVKVPVHELAAHFDEVPGV